MSVKLTHAQAACIRKIKAAGDNGIAIGQPDKTLNVLKRLGFVEIRPRTVSDHTTRAVLTTAGRLF